MHKIHTIPVKHKLGKPTGTESAHLVQFYSSDADLARSLGEYVSMGLRRDEICILITTYRHMQLLDAELSRRGIDPLAARNQGRLIAVDAAETLAMIMVDGMPRLEMFTKVIGGLMAQTARQGLPIRAFGEMVALLWQDGNKPAVVRLERYWNQLARVLPFSLYCAYPELHFLMDPAEREEFRLCHNLMIA